MLALVSLGVYAQKGDGLPSVKQELPTKKSIPPIDSNKFRLGKNDLKSDSLKSKAIQTELAIRDSLKRNAKGMAKRAVSKALEETKVKSEDWVKIGKGSAGTESSFGDREGDFPGQIPVSYSNLNLKTEVQVIGMPLKFSGVLSTMNSRSRQPLNNFQISFDATKWKQKQKALAASKPSIEDAQLKKFDKKFANRNKLNAESLTSTESLDYFIPDPKKGVDSMGIAETNKFRNVPSRYKSYSDPRTPNLQDTGTFKNVPKAKGLNPGNYSNHLNQKRMPNLKDGIKAGTKLGRTQAQDRLSGLRDTVNLDTVNQVNRFKEAARGKIDLKRPSNIQTRGVDSSLAKLPDSVKMIP